jgi:phospholipase/carboxylesterase
MGITRRRFAAVASHLASCAAIAACGTPADKARSGRATLAARPSASRTTWPAGTHALGLGDTRDGFVHLSADAGEDPVPLIVLLHGAGGSGERLLRRFDEVAEGRRVAVLAPDSRGRTWDALLREQSSLLDFVLGSPSTGFGPDIAFLDRALARVFQNVAVDPARVAVGGFSDGATYALSLGLMNGDLFRRLVAFSPGFFVDGEPRGQPRVFVSHGRADEILPIDRCSRRIVPVLEKRGYAVTFREFDGGHDVPEAIAREAFAWVVDEGS